MKTLIIVILIVHWVFGFIWWRKYVYKQVKGYNNDIWEALSLWSAFLGGIFIFLYDYTKIKYEDKSDEKLHLSVVSCSVCGGKDILHEEKEGRGLPPKGWVRKMGDKRRISWRGTWDVWTCKSCGETWRKLR